MTLDMLTTMFQELSGRWDMDQEVILAYFNAGQKFLDDSTDYQTSPSRYIYAGTLGQSYINLIAQAKVISKIELIKDGTKSDLWPVPLAELQALSDTLVSFKDPGLPLYYAMANIRKVNSDALAVADQGKLAIVETGTVADKLGILFECPLDAAYTVDITGKFYSPEIVDGEDPDTFWAINYPFTLIHAALYKLEIGYRNTEGAKDWLASIATDLKLIDGNVAEQSASDISEMRG